VGVVGDRRLLPLGLVQAATFGLGVVAGNWVVTLLERQGVERAAAGLAGSLTLFAGILTRPGGGVLARRRPELARRVVAACLVIAAAGAGLLAVGGPLAVSVLGSALLGLAVGVPFAAVMTVTQRLRPEAPAAAVGLVNGVAVLTILVGTPLAGLAFSLPGEGRLAFAAIGALQLLAFLPLARARL
jgi:cyanate permease